MRAFTTKTQGTLQADRGNCAEAATRLIVPSMRDVSYGGKKEAAQEVRL
jgi:hypothetical protein